MVDLSAYDGIVFDMDGTLIDSMGAHMHAWEVTCKQFNIPFDLGYMYSLGGVPTKKTVEVLNEKHGTDHSPELVAKHKRRVWETTNIVPGLIVDTLEIFHYYRPTMKIGIGTGSERNHAEHLLNHHHLLEKLDALVTASDVIHGKPHAETFLTVAKRMGVDPKKCVVFEDTAIGEQAAKNAGMDCILVKSGKVQV